MPAHHPRSSARAIAAVLGVLLAGCAARHPPAPPPPPQPQPSGDPERLATLFRSRSGVTPGDYCIGPGDVLVIDVFGWQEMSNRHVRVSPRGTITLPFVGEVPAAGKTEAALRSELERRLRAGYVRDPHVRVFVERFTSQQVSVTGAVPRPGLYALTREHRTLYDLLAQAGGLTEQAGGRVVFSPAALRECNSAPTGTGAWGPTAAGPPLAFDLDTEVGPRGIDPLRMPMLGGDSIVVTRGRFLVQGWVDRPGLYSFSPGMTAFDAATIAGGALFPADLGKVHVLRARADGTKKVLSINLNDVRHGDAHDITLHEGDVVKFDASLWRLAPYSVYWTLKNVVSVGAGVGPTM